VDKYILIKNFGLKLCVFFDKIDLIILTYLIICQIKDLAELDNKMKILIEVANDL